MNKNTIDKLVEIAEKHIDQLIEFGLARSRKEAEVLYIKSFSSDRIKFEILAMNN